MAYFPLLQHLRIDNYGLYPGPKRDGLFEIDFQTGLTLVLGANGLGKTTLMTLLFRMLAGTHDLSLPEGEIGNVSLTAHEIGSWLRAQFAHRVNDGAQDATARLRFSLGRRVFETERQLANLALTSWTIDGIEQPGGESEFKGAILTAAELGTFADWLLLLRTLVFFFEDRRALVWDYGAQRQLLRCLFLAPTRAAEWTTQERAILELDSRMRNLQSAVRKEQKIHNRQAAQVQFAPGVRAALVAAERLLERLREEHDALIKRIEVAEQSRQRARLDALRAQGTHDQTLRELERARLQAVNAHLPTADDSIRFILTRLMSDDHCLACGTSGVREKRELLEAALARHHCVVCDSALPEVEVAVDLGNERLRVLQAKVDAASVQMHEQARARDDAQIGYEKDSHALAQCAADLSDAEQAVSNLVNQLPPDERKLTEHYARFKAMEDLVADLRAQLHVARGAFAEALKEYRDEIQLHAEGIKTKFESAARGFLVEDSTLSWAPVSRQVGQAGGTEPVDYPAFAVELSGSDFVAVQRRDNPSQVSESQREFIDLAFRMALIHVASPDHASTLAIDAPESSLDAVFVDRAADVLARFADPSGANRLVVTSNLGAGELVPALLKAASPAGRRAVPLVNLFEAGIPTRAMLDNKVSYDRYLHELLEKLD